MLSQFAERLSNLGGLAEMRAEDRKRLRIINRTAASLVLLSGLYLPVFAASGIWYLFWSHLGYLLGYTLCLVANALGYRRLGRHFVLQTGVITIVWNSLVLGEAAGVQFYYAAAIIGPFMTFDLREKKQIAFYLAEAVVFFAVDFFFFSGFPLRQPFSPEVERFSYYGNFGAVVMLCGLFAYYLMREQNVALNAVERIKFQQDGDYYLTILLANPLSNNLDSSVHCPAEMRIAQKKQVQFKELVSEIGGDIGIAGTPSFQYEPHVFFANADAIVKSLQGAGKAIAFGTMQRTRAGFACATAKPAVSGLRQTRPGLAWARCSKH